VLLYLLASDHTAMLDGGANQLTEMISPALIFEQLWALASNASSLFYFVDNVSDMLPVPLSTAAALAFAWDPSQFVNTDNKDGEEGGGGGNDWNATQKRYLTAWSQVQYGGTTTVTSTGGAAYIYENAGEKEEGRRRRREESDAAVVAQQVAALYEDYFNIPHVHAGLSDEWIGARLGAQARKQAATVYNILCI
jgi:hypothetical protein